MLIFILCFGATAAGAYTNPKQQLKKVKFSGITVSGEGPVGVELVKSKNSKVTFELLNMDKENTCATNAKIVNDIMQITVNNDVPNGINVDFGSLMILYRREHMTFRFPLAQSILKQIQLF